MYKKPEDQTKIRPSAFDFRFNIRNYVNYSRFLIITTTILFTIGGTYYAFFHTPKYMATVILSSKVYSSLSGAASSEERELPIEDRETAAPRELELIKSQAVLSRVVQRLKLDTKVSGNGFSSKKNPLAIEAFEAPPSMNNKKIVLEMIDDGNYSLDIADAEFSSRGAIGKEETFDLPENENLKIFLREKPKSKEKTFTLLKKPRQEIIDEILSITTFEAPGIENMLVTNLIKISVKGMEPDLIAKIANTIAEVAIDQSKREEQKAAQRSMQLTAVEQKNIRKLLHEKSRRLSNMKIALHQFAYNDEVNAQSMASMLEKVEEQVNLSKSELSKLKERLTDEHPKVKEARAGLNSYEDAQGNLIAISNKSLENGTELLDLQREIQMYNRIYEEIGSDYEQFKARFEAPVGSLSLVESSMVPDSPVSYSRPVIILLSALIGVICGYIVALVLD